MLSIFELNILFVVVLGLLYFVDLIRCWPAKLYTLSFFHPLIEGEAYCVLVCVQVLGQRPKILDMLYMRLSVLTCDFNVLKTCNL